MMHFRLPHFINIVLLLTAFVVPSWAAAQVTVTARPAILAGNSPAVRLGGISPRAEVTVHALQSSFAWAQDADGQWSQQPIVLHAWATFAASPDGTVDLDKAAPIAGTYRTGDSRGLIWSGFRRGDPALGPVAVEELYVLADARPGEIVFRVVEFGTVVAEARTTVGTRRAGLTVEPISLPGLVGVFAAPADGHRLPVVIQLHGSEGGNLENATERALRFASRGYATFAVTYFSPRDDDPNTAPDLVEIPIEMLAKARDWLSARPEADTDRIAVHGWSKGAEFALVAAERYDWIKAVIACVPTDLVWQGGGAEPGLPRHSSWTFGDRPLPFVPLYPYIEAERLYRTNTDRYERSLRELGDAGGAARIGIEIGKARLLLIGSDRDAVWASGEMARRLQIRMEAAGRGRDVETLIFPEAGHDVCGTGVSPVRLYSTDPPGPQAADPVANGEGSIAAATATLDFLQRSIGPAHVL